jgi:hypothetical protein
MTTTATVTASALADQAIVQWHLRNGITFAEARDAADGVTACESSAISCDEIAHAILAKLRHPRHALSLRTRAERALDRLLDSDSHDYGTATTRRAAAILARILRHTPTRGSRAAARAIDAAATRFSVYGHNSLERRERMQARAQRLATRDARAVLERGGYYNRLLSVTICNRHAVAVMAGEYHPDVFIGRPTDYGDDDNFAMTWTKMGETYQRSDCQQEDHTRAAEELVERAKTWTWR